MNRLLRDVVAEAMRRERLGLTRPLWNELDEVGKEEWRKRADQVIRVIRAIRVIGELEADLLTAPTGEFLVSNQIVGNPGRERAVRRDAGDGFSIVVIDRKTGEQTVEQSSTMEQGMLLCGRVLSSDPAVLKEKGLGRLLAAYGEIYRLNAAAGRISK
jgi:hypothetical protein